MTPFTSQDTIKITQQPPYHVLPWASVVVVVVVSGARWSQVASALCSSDPIWVFDFHCLQGNWSCKSLH